MSNPLNACPHCNGTDGIQFFHDERWLKNANWDGSNVDGDFERVVYASKPKCQQCGRFVDVDLTTYLAGGAVVPPANKEEE